MEKVAIVGTGVAGTGCAWHLHGKADITLLEKDNRPGGHTNTVVVDEDGTPVPIDTGFIVFNHQTYPNLCRLFEELGVVTKRAEMSFSVHHVPTGLEYNGMGLNKLFAQRKNIFNPRFLGLVAQILRFFRVGNEALSNPPEVTLREFVETHGLGRDFLDLYLVPMSSAVWSTNPRDVLDFPASTLLRFFHNHGFLGVTTHHPWYTVDGGAKTYMEKIFAKTGRPQVSSGVAKVRETAEGVSLILEDGRVMDFDRVILACHGDQALRMLESPDDAQRRLLGAFSYEKNHALLHTWEGVMPERRLAWASWNYRVEAPGTGPAGPTTHYWMNALQGVSKKRNYFVSLNSAGTVPDSHVLYETWYDHPVFNLAAAKAQGELPTLNTRSKDQRIFFCGSYFKYGFHEDAYASAVELSQVVGRCLQP